MAKLTTKARKGLAASTFGLPSERKFPITDKSHAANAKARATQQENRGSITPAQKVAIDAKADRMLGGSTAMAKYKKRGA